MRQPLASLIVAVALLTAAGWAYSADSGEESALPVPAGENIENIVVTGQRPEALRRLMLDFIVEIGDRVSSARGFARWRDRLCVGVYNLPDQKAAQYLADKLTLHALEFGLKTGTPGCEPNLHIVFSPDARALAGRLAAESPRLFRPFGNTEYTTQGFAALEQFKVSEAPVRWWQITMVVDEFGHSVLPIPGIGGSTVVRGVASRLKSPINDAIWASLVIIDAGKLGNVSWPQLADYLAMVSLAQVSPDARPSGHDSILNLFGADRPPPGMTDMDRVYLRALYEMDTMTLPHTQRGIFSQRMVRELRELEQAE